MCGSRRRQVLRREKAQLYQGKLKTWLKEKTGLLPTKCHGWGGGDLRAGGPSVSDLNSLPRKSGINLTQSPEEHFKLNLRC